VDIVPTNMTIADYCEAMERNEIQVNRDYQRSDKVWPSAARSFLIETVLLGYPMPKLSLYQRTDVKSRKVFKEIVDGQQRSSAIFDFYQGKFDLHPTIETTELIGADYAALPPGIQERFLSYPLGIDLFVSAAPENIREVFRRINSYNVPLNPEEQRHAEFQGAFKWFIHKMAKRLDSQFVGMGVFSIKNIVRMADAKLLTELCFAFEHGIETTKKPQLDAMYEENDVAFPAADDHERRIMGAMERVAEWEQIHNSELMKSFVVMTLLTAISHLERRADALQPFFASHSGRIRPEHVANLVVLADALGADNPPRKFTPFIQSCTSKTNVREHRATRFEWICRALTEPRI